MLLPQPSAHGRRRAFLPPGPRPILEIFPEAVAFEVLGHWADPTTQELKHAVRFFCTDFDGRQVGQDLSTRVLGSVDFLLFTALRQLRTTIALERQVLTDEDRQQLDELLRARIVSTWLELERIHEPADRPPTALVVAPKTQSFLQRLRLLFSQGFPRRTDT